MSLATWFANLEAEAKVELGKLGDEAQKVLNEIGPVVVTDVENFLKEIGTLAIAAVMAEAPKVLSGGEKFGNAVASVIQSVEAQAKTVAVQDAQMAVQAAYRAIQVVGSTP